MAKRPYDLRMFFPDYRASIRIGNFVKCKHPVLSQIIGKPESTHLRYELSEFKTLLLLILNAQPNISGLRIYFASYPDMSDGSLIPAGLEKTLTLIYVPTASIGGKHTDTGHYYIKDATNNIVTLPKTTASNWVKNFQQTKLNILDQIFDGTNETKSIWYEMQNIKDLYDFLNNANGGSSDLPDAISVFFAAYHLKAKETEEPLSNYQHKLSLIISLMNIRNIQGTSYYYYLNEDIYDNYPEDLNPESFSSERVPCKHGSANTGVPCPPIPDGQSKCPGTSLPE